MTYYVSQQFDQRRIGDPSAERYAQIVEMQRGRRIGLLPFWLLRVTFHRFARRQALLSDKRAIDSLLSLRRLRVVSAVEIRK